MVKPWGTMAYMAPEQDGKHFYNKVKISYD